MALRFAKALAAVALLAALWALGTVRRSGAESWLRPAGATSAGRAPVRILQFYTTSGSVRAGEKALLCYGVENAKSVRIAPLMENVSPSAKSCLEVVPQHTTHYTILAEGFDGHVVMQSLTLPVETGPGIEPRPLNYGMAPVTPPSEGERGWTPAPARVSFRDPRPA
jgi:hypothetical protein